MEICQVIIIAFTAAVISILLRNTKPEISMLISIAAGIVIFFMMLGKVTVVIETLNTFARKANIDTLYLSIILKITGIAYIASFGIEICKDAGENSLAAKIEFAGKLIIAVMAVPILMAVMDTILKLMP